MVTSPMVISEPAAAFAATRCLSARIRDTERWLTRDHPSRCGWCDYPTDVLDGLIRGWNGLVDYDEHNGTQASGAGAFSRLPQAEQRRQIEEAQQLEDGPPPGGSKSSGTAAGQGPHRSRARGQTGSNVSAPPRREPVVPPRPDWAGGES